ncbi:hypothetical protein MG293_000621 [Ovis ammon polii]|uniref:Mannosyltransferase n=1 Tax=Ovis ammon polii TaxID=230172 RepID=A0AAD4YIL9_OVIAM|nr:hypothetical protein MG293_000621 [Ovis ammon polii]
MAYSNYGKNFFEGPLDEENVIFTLPVNEEIIEDHQVEPGVSSTSEVKEEALNTDNQVPLPETNELEEDCPSSSFRRSVCPLLTTLPPINNVSRDTLRYWCQQLKLSTDGQKIEVYRRLQEHAYPEKDQYIPKSSQEARMHSCSRKHSMVTKRGSVQKRKMSESEERTKMVDVVTSAQVAMLAAWSRIAARAVHPKAVNSRALRTSESFLPQASGVRWCVVHGRLLLADTEGWVRLQFQAVLGGRNLTVLFPHSVDPIVRWSLGTRRSSNTDTADESTVMGHVAKGEKQTGYVHPDEFFQSPEVIAGDVLGVAAARPWEFHPSSPCRTAVFPLLTSGSAFWLLRLWEEWGPWPGTVSGYMLLVGPRLLLTALSFALDLAVYHLAPGWGAERWNALLLLSGSYVTLVFYTRTFSNAIEGLLFAWLLVLVSPGVAGSRTPRKPAPGPRWHGWLLGGLVVAGFFNRPTFLAFALVPLFLWGTCGATDSSFKSLTQQALALLPGASLTAVVFVAVDSWYFSGPSRPSTLVLTPANFLRYNLDPVNLARHGTHARLTHLAVNGFLLFGALHAHSLQAAWQQLRAGLQAFAQMGFPRTLGAWSPRPSPRSLLLLFYFVPLALLSAFSHQEARFLIPLLVPLVLLCSLQTQPAPCRGTLALFNILGALFFGCLHQGGLVPGLGHLERVVHAPEALRVPTHFTLVFTHTYMPPRHLLHLPGLGLPVDVVDMGGAEDRVLCQALNNFTRHPACQAAGGPWLCRLFVVTPGTTRLAVRKCRFPLRSETLIFPHLTLEDPPTLSSLLSKAWRDHLSLHILELGEKPDNMTQKPLPKTQP